MYVHRSTCICMYIYNTFELTVIIKKYIIIEECTYMCKFMNRNLAGSFQGYVPTHFHEIFKSRVME